MKVAICIPCHSDTKALFTLSLADMLIKTLGQDEAPQIEASIARGTRVEMAREHLAMDALSRDPDYILWLDADHTFPATTLTRLLTHNLPFVGCNYRRRDNPQICSANSGGRTILPKADGLEAVDFIGFGVCLVKADVFRQLPQPWFAMSPTMGEDGYFCQLARSHGIQPYVDHSLSMEVGHIAETVLRF